MFWIIWVINLELLQTIEGLDISYNMFSMVTGLVRSLPILFGNLQEYLVCEANPEVSRYSSKAVSILSKTPPWLFNLRKESFEADRPVGFERLEFLEYLVTIKKTLELP